MRHEMHRHIYYLEMTLASELKYDSVYTTIVCMLSCMASSLGEEIVSLYSHWYSAHPGIRISVTKFILTTMVLII